MYQTVILPHFKRQLKPLLKKHRDLKASVIELLQHFDVRQHDALGSSVYKIRLNTRSLSRGKSKSFRLIILVMEVEHRLVPITIYAKSDVNTLLQKEINDHLYAILSELHAFS